MLTKKEAIKLEAAVQSATRLEDSERGPLYEAIKRATHNYDGVTPTKHVNFIVQMDAAERMTIRLHCPCCGSDEVRLMRTLGSIREYHCNKCEQEWTVE